MSSISRAVRFVTAFLAPLGITATIMAPVAVPAPDTVQPDIIQAALPTVRPCVYRYRWPRTTITWNYAGSRTYYGNAWQAAEDWNAARTGITLRSVAASQVADITFRDVRVGVNGYAGQAQRPTGWPSSWGDFRQHHPFVFPAPDLANPGHVDIRLNRDFLDNTARGRIDFLRTFTAAHEIGHALGLAHSTLCGGLSSDINSPYHFSLMEIAPTFGPSEDIFLLSWMLSRYPASIYDRTELQMLYRLPLQ